jgi:transposase-like protein
VVYLWIDGVYVKVGLEKERAALLVVIGALLDGRKVVLAVEPGYRESTESWSEVLRDLKGRGLNCPSLVVGDGNLGIWAALEQRCWNHKMVNVLDKLPKKLRGQAKRRLQDIVYAETCEAAEAKRDDFVHWCEGEGYGRAGDALVRDWERMVTFYRFPQEHWRHLRTINIVESPFAGLRLRTDAAKRYKKVENAAAVIWKMLLLAEHRFQRLDAAEKLMQVYLESGFRERNEKTETKQEEVLAIV